jgi:hypothetical protein
VAKPRLPQAQRASPIRTVTFRAEVQQSGAPIGAAGKTKNPSTWEGFLALSEGEVGLVPHPADLGASRIKR